MTEQVGDSNKKVTFTWPGGAKLEINLDEFLKVVKPNGKFKLPGGEWEQVGETKPKDKDL